MSQDKLFVCAENCQGERFSELPAVECLSLWVHFDDMICKSHPNDNFFNCVHDEDWVVHGKGIDLTALDSLKLPDFWGVGGDK
jgi:hypothetical protein